MDKKEVSKGELTIRQVRACVPKSKRMLVNQEVVDVLNAVENDNPELVGAFKENYWYYSSNISTYMDYSYGIKTRSY
jgi:hypothetical protein